MYNLLFISSYTPICLNAQMDIEQKYMELPEKRAQTDDR